MQIYSKEINNFYIFHVLCLDLKCLNRETERKTHDSPIQFKRKILIRHTANPYSKSVPLCIQDYYISHSKFIKFLMALNTKEDIKLLSKLYQKNINILSLVRERLFNL